MRVLLTGGGTGGHIYPALAVARRLREMSGNVTLLYVGTERGLESRIVPNEGISFRAIEMEGFKRSLALDSLKYNFRSMKLFLQSIKEAKEIIQEFKPDVVLGTGGYVSAPVCYAAAKAGVATVVHEQNSLLGLTNKFLLRSIDKLAISFDDILTQVDGYEEKVVYTGNPRAQEVASAELSAVDSLYGLDISKEILLIFGGSRGAVRINQAVIDAYPDLLQRKYQVIFVPGEKHYDEIVAALNRITPLERHPNFVVKPYIDNMIDVLNHSSAIVSRSGATTIAEITVLGIPSILIPSPNVTDDHQTKNAMSLVKHEAATLLKESDLTRETFMENVDALMMNESTREKMSENALDLGEPHATDILIKVMLDEIKKNQA